MVEPHPQNVEPHPRFVEVEVRTALKVLSRPDVTSDDDAVARLVELGIDRERAWKLALLVPCAMAHVVIDGIQVTPPEEFKVMSSKGADPLQGKFAEEPFYLEARRLAQDAYITGYRELLIPVGGRSAEWKVINDAREMGYSDEQLSGIQVNIVFWGLEPEVWSSH